MISVEKAISVWNSNDGIQAATIVDGASTITNLSSSTYPISSPEIAIDGLGNAIAVWVQDTPGTIKISYYTKNNNSWSLAVDLSPSGTYARPIIAMNRTGNAIVIWQINYNLIQARYYNKTTGIWSLVQNISSIDGTLNFNQVEIDSIGNAIAVWRQYNKIQSTRYTINSGWSPVENLSLSGGDYPRLAMNSIGNAIVVWVRGNIIESRRYTNTWSGTEILSTGVSLFPKIAMDSIGNAIAFWTESTNITDQYIFKSSYYEKYSNSWSERAVNISFNILSTSKNQYQIEMDSVGNAIAIWPTKVDVIGDYRIQASYYSNNSWSASKNISAIGSVSFFEGGGYVINAEPQIQMDNLGNAIAVWIFNSGGDNSIQVSYYTKNTDTWSTPATTLSNLGVYTFIYPQIVIDYVEPSPPPPTNNTKVIFAIDADYDSLITGTASLNTFEVAVTEGVVRATGADAQDITIDNVTRGSIVTELTLPTEYVAALQASILNGSFYIVINGVVYRAFRNSFVIVDNICFKKGTMILTPNGYTAVENLKMGDLVTTAQGGIVKIQKVTSFVGKREKCPLYVLIKDSLAPNRPLMDLYMSEGHAYRHKGKWSHMKCSSLAIKVDIDNIEYYNIAVYNYIENTLIANGVEVESLFNMKGLKMRWDCKKDNCKPIIELLD
jgi:hypothetical protein